MTFTAFVNVCKRTYILPQNQATKNVSRRYRKLTVTKFRTRTLWTSMFMIKRAKCFPKKIGQQRRDVIKIQQLIHLNSNALKTISGSTYQKKLSSLEEIIVSCHWLQRSSLYSSMSGNTWCVTTVSSRLSQVTPFIAIAQLNFIKESTSYIHNTILGISNTTFT